MGSGPNSSKANFFAARFKSLGVDVTIPDYNLPDFENLTVSRIVCQTLDLIDDNEEIILMGSSLGGFAAAHAAEKKTQIIKTILLAPAFQLATRRVTQLTKDEIKAWRKNGSREYFHYGYNKSLPLNYAFHADALSLEKKKFRRQLPCLIFHGIKDEIVPYEVSINYLKENTQAQLVLLNSDHQLGDVTDIMWRYVRVFLDI